jgi:PAS domain S-box-containing protein
MNRFANLKIPIAIVTAALCWAFIADPLITYLAEHLEPLHRDLFRSVNDFTIVLIISFILYTRIRKQQRELRKAAEDYLRLFEEIPTPMYIFDSNTLQFLTVNTAAISLYGFSRKEFLNLKATDIRPAEELPAFLDIINHIPDNYFDAGRWLHQNMQGEQFYVHIFTHCTFFKGKAAKQVLVINIDQKVKAELALQEKTAELGNVLESITDALYTLDKDWNFTYINKEYEKVQQRKRENLLGKNVWEMFPYTKDLKFYTQYHKAVREQVSVHFEEYNPVTMMWVWVNAYPTKNGIAIYFRDITKEKTTQEKIFNDGQNLRAIINNTRDLIWSVDREFNIITGNQAFWERVENVTGKTEKEVTNADFEQELMKVFLVSYQKAFQGEAFKFVRQREYDRQIRFEELSFNPIYDQKQQVIGVNCFLRDITEQQQHLEQIEQQNAKLKEIAWIQSHKVRVPVANLLGLVQLLESESDQEAIDKIRQTSLQLDAVIREITAQTGGPPV